MIFQQPTVHPSSLIQLPAPQYGQNPLLVRSHGIRYLITGNTLLEPDVITNIINTSRTPKEALRRLITAYRERGYFLVVARAKVDHNDVHIYVVQGQIIQKDVSSDLAPFYAGLEGQDLTASQMIRRNILADAYSSRNGMQMNVGFSPSSNPGGTNLSVQQRPNPNFYPLNGSVTFGNYGSRYTSSYISGLNLSLQPGHGILLSGGFNYGISGLSEKSKGSTYYNGTLGFSVITPWGIYGASQQWTHYRLGEVTAPYYFTGNVAITSLTGSQLLFANTTNRISVNEAYTFSDYKETVLDGLYTLSDQNYQYYTFGANVNHQYQLFQRAGNLALAATINHGVSGYHGSFIDSLGAPSPKFTYLTLQINAMQSLPLGFSLQGSASGQWSNQTMPANNQYVVGGFGNLSAYTPGVIQGDSGYAGRISVQAPSVRLGKFTATGSLFGEDVAVTDHYLSPGQRPWKSLSDIGLGVTLSSPWGTSINAMTAIPVGHNGFSSSELAAVRNSRIDAYFLFTQTF